MTETRHRATTAASRRAVILAAMVRGATKIDAAAAAGVGLRTVDRITDDPQFRRDLADERGRIYASAMDNLKTATGAAVDTLAESMKSKNDAIRIRAAVSVLSFAFRWREVSDIEDRLAKLEQVAAEVSPLHRMGPF